jgi:hypothetical protein
MPPCERHESATGVLYTPPLFEIMKFVAMKLYYQCVSYAIAIVFTTVLAQNSTYDVLDYVDQLIGSANGGSWRLGSAIFADTV